MVKNPSANAGDVRNQDSIPGSGRYPGGRHESLQYSCVENPRDKGAWWPTAHRVAESDMTEAISLIRVFQDNDAFMLLCCWNFYHKYKWVEVILLVVSLNLLHLWISGKESACQCGRCGFSSWVGKILWWRKWQVTPVFLPGKSHGQWSLVGYSSWSRKDSDTT